MKKRGKFITLEGIEGSGKSTQIKAIASFLKKKKKKYLILREPGGTRVSEQIREILLSKKNVRMVSETELLLYLAARAQIVREVIEPHLKKGVHVICDRFYDSTLAYQGYGLKMNRPLVEKMNAFATGGLKPNITLLLDVPVSVGLKRAGRTDRIEARSNQYHNRVRKGFLSLEKKERRIKLIDGTQEKQAITEQIKKHLKNV